MPLVLVYQKMKNYGEALKAAEKALALAPAQPPQIKEGIQKAIDNDQGRGRGEKVNSEFGVASTLYTFFYSTRSMIRPALALERLSFLEPEGIVGYRYGQDARDQETMDYLEFQ